MTKNRNNAALEKELKDKFEETLLSLTGSEVQVRHKLYRLDKVLALYEGYWDEWKSTSACFLTEREIKSIESYREYQTHSILASELGVTPSRVSAIYNKALRRLENNHHLYRHWIANKIFTQAGLHEHLEGADQFLMLPLHELKISKKLYMLLAPEGENLSEILTIYSEAQLKRARGWGKKHLDEFKQLLDEHHCLDRFRLED